ncbi:MAG TPA: MBL fold metallo-hydrolase [Actinotalea sp.]|nr:MBL fold metallo-hydrolase [Actinotalea sp.]
MSGPGSSGVRLSWWGHACVRLEHPGGRVVVDPGAWSDLDGALEAVDAILVTHEHADHVRPDRVVAAMSARPGLRVWAPSPVVALLAAAGAPPARLHPVRGGDRLEVTGLVVDVVGEQHAVIHPDVPRIANVGYVLAGVLHPGDAFTVPEQQVRVLLTPVGAPWLKLAEAIDFVRAVRPTTVVPIHDAVLSDAGRGLADRLVGGLGGAPQYRRLAVGEGIEVG